jgi:hypothetical protein
MRLEIRLLVSALCGSFFSALGGLPCGEHVEPGVPCARCLAGACRGFLSREDRVLTNAATGRGAVMQAFVIFAVKVFCSG